MSHTTELLDKFIKARNLTSDRHAMIALGLSHGAAAHWRQERGHAGVETIAAMCKTTGDDEARYQLLIAADRSKKADERKAWERVLARVASAAACLLFALSTPATNASEIHQDQWVKASQTIHYAK